MLLLVTVLVLYIMELNKNRRLLHLLEVADQSLNDSDERFKAILQNVHAFILLVNRRLQVVRTNYYDITGTQKPNYTVCIGDLLRCDNALSSSGGCGTNRACTGCPIRIKVEASFRSKKSFSDLETVLNLRDAKGEVIQCYTNISGEYLLLDSEDSMVVTVHDVTRLKQVERELKIARKKAEDADQSKSAFLANMSHEIRTPLSAIVGFSELLASATADDEKVQYLEIVRSNNNLLQQLVSDILDLSKIEAGSLAFTVSEVDVNQVMSDLEQYFRLQMQEKGAAIEIVLVAPLEKCLIQTDRNRFTQVISNFMTNAVKFTESGTITLGYKPDKGGYYFYVRDTGCGIPEDKLEHIFKRFVKVDTDRGGTGLGLAISEMIVQKMKGQIGAESELGKGSNFWFRLPVEVK